MQRSQMQNKHIYCRNMGIERCVLLIQDLRASQGAERFVEFGFYQSINSLLFPQQMFIFV
jgi:hypothetical protein